MIDTKIISGHFGISIEKLCWGEHIHLKGKRRKTSTRFSTDGLRKIHSQIILLPSCPCRWRNSDILVSSTPEAVGNPFEPEYRYWRHCYYLSMPEHPPGTLEYQFRQTRAVPPKKLHRSIYFEWYVAHGCNRSTLHPDSKLNRDCWCHRKKWLTRGSLHNFARYIPNRFARYREVGPEKILKIVFHDIFHWFFSEH